jgi:hypothetical protein
MLVWLEGKVSRRTLWVSAVWLVPVALYLVYIAALQVSGVGLNAREAGLLAEGLRVQNLPQVLVEANISNLIHQYLTAWQDALLLSPFGGSSLLFRVAAVTGLIISGLFGTHLWAFHRPAFGPIGSAWPLRRWFGLVVISLLWTVLGYAVFSLSSVRYDGWRLSFYTSLGAGLTVALVLYALAFYAGRLRWLAAALFLSLALALLLNRSAVGLAALSLVAALGFVLRPPHRFTVLLGVVLTVSLVRQLDLHRWMTSEALNVQTLLTEVVELVPGISETTPVIVVLDSQEWGTDLPFDTSRHFDLALDLVFDAPGRIGWICVLGTPGWGWEGENCTFTPEGIRLSTSAAAVTYGYDAVVMLTAHPDGTVSLVEQIPPVWGAPAENGYSPLHLLSLNSSLPHGLETWFNPRPLPDR